MQLSISAPSIKYIARCTLVHLDAESSAGSSHGGIQQGCRFLLIGLILTKTQRYCLHSRSVVDKNKDVDQVLHDHRIHEPRCKYYHSIYLISGWFIALRRVLPFIEFGDLSVSSTSRLLMINSIAIGLVILCFVPSSVCVMLIFLSNRCSV